MCKRIDLEALIQISLELTGKVEYKEFDKHCHKFFTKISAYVENREQRELA